LIDLRLNGESGLASVARGKKMRNGSRPKSVTNESESLFREGFTSSGEEVGNGRSIFINDEKNVAEASWESCDGFCAAYDNIWQERA
jgi:hypothetical protein